MTMTTGAPAQPDHIDATPARSDGAGRRRFRLPRLRFPRLKRPKLGIRNFARRKIREQLKGDRLTFGRGMQEVLNIAGFGAVVEAWKHPTHRTTKVLVSLAQKAADMMAGRFVNTTIRLFAISMLTGFFGPGSVLLTMGLTGLATGVGSAIYSYHRNYLQDKLRGPKEERSKARYVTHDRLHAAGMAFVGGFVGGSFGAWLGKTAFFQSIVNGIKGAVGHVVDALRTGAHAVESVIVPAHHATAPAALPAKGTLQGTFDTVAARPGPVSSPVSSSGAAPVSPAVTSASEPVSGPSAR